MGMVSAGQGQRVPAAEERVLKTSLSQEAKRERGQKREASAHLTPGLPWSACLQCFRVWGQDKLVQSSSSNNLLKMALSSPRRWFSKPCHGTTAGPRVATGRGGRNDRRYHPRFTEEAARSCAAFPSHQRARCAGDTRGTGRGQGRVRQLPRQTWAGRD